MAAIEHLSHSTVEDVRTCSMKVKLKKVDKVAQRPGWALIGGNAVHSVTEWDDRRDCGLPVEAEKLDFDATMDRLIAEQLEKNPTFKPADYHTSGRKSARYPNKEDEKWWRENGPLMVERWAAFKRSTTWSIWITPQGDPAVELKLRGQWGGMPTDGYVDLVMETAQGDLVVVDKKTGSRNPKSATQLAMYGVDIAKLFGVEVPYGAFFMAREGGLTPPVVLAPLVPDLERDYAVARAIIEQDLFLTSPSDLCRSCGVNHACPFYSPVSTLGAVT